MILKNHIFIYLLYEAKNLYTLLVASKFKISNFVKFSVADAESIVSVKLNVTFINFCKTLYTVTQYSVQNFSQNFVKQ